jgi:hypothetical protein
MFPASVSWNRESSRVERFFDAIRLIGGLRKGTPIRFKVRARNAEKKEQGAPYPDPVTVIKYLFCMGMEQVCRSKFLILLKFFADIRRQRG